jgi:AraC-like DNA-binding protein
METFPDFNQPGFNINLYNKRFIESNVIIHASSNSVAYAPHWGPLSVKCAFNGKEHYNVNNCEYAVNDTNYMVINEGNYYSSLIDSKTDVRSFTVNFSPLFINDFLQSWHESDDTILLNFENSKLTKQIDFIEKLYLHDDTVSPILFKLSNMSTDFVSNEILIEELYFLLLERLLIKRKDTINEIQQIHKVKTVTKIEIYKRLIKAKDYIDSFYNRDISLSELSKICLLNPAYLLRQFKNHFHITPRQYIIQKRVEAAKKILENDSQITISNVCNEVGYDDLSSFSKLFKHFYKVSPEKFQQQ